MANGSINDLTEELLMDIFSRLRAKPVMRCKCVCKPWWVLLSDPTFIKLHLARSLLASNAPCVLLTGYPFKTLDCGFLEEDQESPKPIEHFNVDGGHPPVGFDCVIDSCNGLLCLSAGPPTFSLSLLNPCTREVVHMPSHPCFRCQGVTQRVLQGFGYDYVADEYKAVTIKYRQVHKQGLPDYSEFLHVMVHTLATGCWTRLDAAAPPTSPFHIPDYCEFSPMVHLNGLVHFLNMHPSSKSIISFDLHTNKFGLVPLPSYHHIHHENIYDTCALAMLKGCLTLDRHITVDCPDEDEDEDTSSSIAIESSFDLWMMTSYGVKESWVMIFSNLTTSTPCSARLNPLFILKNGQIVLLMGNNKLVFYDPAPNTTTRPVTICPPSICVEASYVETLTSISSLMPGNTLQAHC